MTIYSCDCNRFEDVDPHKGCPNGVPSFLHNLNGEPKRKKFREIKNKCEFRGKLVKDEYGDKVLECNNTENSEKECAHWICPAAHELCTGKS